MRRNTGLGACIPLAKDFHQLISLRTALCVFCYLIYTVASLTLNPLPTAPEPMAVRSSPNRFLHQAHQSRPCLRTRDSAQAQCTWAISNSNITNEKHKTAKDKTPPGLSRLHTSCVCSACPRWIAEAGRKGKHCFIGPQQECTHWAAAGFCHPACVPRLTRKTS